MLMLVRWGILVHQLRTSNRLLARDTLLPGLIKSVQMLLLMVLTSHLVYFYINAIPATILFDSGATHSFMSA
jgi:hypothetical protein